MISESKRSRFICLILISQSATAKATPSAFGTSPKCDGTSVAFGGGRVGVVLCFAFQRKLNHANYPVDILHHIVVPESNDFVAQSLKILGSFRIILNLL